MRAQKPSMTSCNALVLHGEARTEAVRTTGSQWQLGCRFRAAARAQPTAVCGLRALFSVSLEMVVV